MDGSTNSKVASVFDPVREGCHLKFSTRTRSASKESSWCQKKRLPLRETESDGIETLTGSAVVPRDHPALPGHFPGHPIVPGVVLLELMEALLAHNGYGVRGCPQVKFLVPVAPQCPLTLRAVISHHTSARFAIDIAGKSAVVGRFDCVPSVDT